MSDTASRRVFLVGISGSGKSTVGPRLARLLGWRFADTDEMVAERAGKPIPAIFHEDGERAFRGLECEILDDIGHDIDLVVATGGGAPTTERCRAVLRRGLSVWLDTAPEAAAARLAAERLAAEPADRDRPLLEGAHPAARLRELLDQRRVYYEEADAIVPVDGRTPDQIAEEVAAILRDTLGRDLFGEAAAVEVGGHRSPIFVRDGLIDHVGAVCKSAGLSGRAFILSDTVVHDHFAPRVTASVAAVHYETVSMAIPSGEQYKTLETVSTVYDWLLDHRVERSDFMVCIGGGVVTDLGGFAAATCLRGIRFVHVPTSLLGMVDAAVGGKTGVNHRLGKNMIGAFAQPAAVVIDPGPLLSLPDRHVSNGLAEVIKHGLILDARLVADLEQSASDIRSLVSADLIARSVAIKAEVVSEDERESGRRSLLNYGHTVGHAIEAVTGYEWFLHGEAVAVGMHAAGRIAVELGMLEPAALDRQQALLRAGGLPERAPGLDPAAVFEATRGDKKVRDGRVRWVLLERLGDAVLRDDVPDAVALEAITAVVS